MRDVDSDTARFGSPGIPPPFLGADLLVFFGFIGQCDVYVIIGSSLPCLYQVFPATLTLQQPTTITTMNHDRGIEK